MPAKIEDQTELNNVPAEAIRSSIDRFHHHLLIRTFAHPYIVIVSFLYIEKPNLELCQLSLLVCFFEIWRKQCTWHQDGNDLELITLYIEKNIFPELNHFIDVKNEAFPVTKVPQQIEYPNATRISFSEK